MQEYAGRYADVQEVLKHAGDAGRTNYATDFGRAEYVQSAKCANGSTFSGDPVHSKDADHGKGMEYNRGSKLNRGVENTDLI